MAAGGKSSAQRDQVAFLLAAGRSKTEASLKAGVARRTITNWLKEPVFQQRIRELKDTLLSRAVGRLVGAGSLAAKTLVALMGKDNKPQVRRAAAAALLASLFKGVDTLDLSQRLAALEESERLRGERK
jgi:hypothetical protein